MLSPLGCLGTSTVRDNYALNTSTIALTSDSILTNLCTSGSYTDLNPPFTISILTVCTSLFSKIHITHHQFSTLF